MGSPAVVAKGGQDRILAITKVSARAYSTQSRRACIFYPKKKTSLKSPLVYEAIVRHAGVVRPHFC